MRALINRILKNHESHTLADLTPAVCTHDRIQSVLAGLVRKSSGLLASESVGTSFEGRSINLVRCGNGKTRVLLWSQMHGDEPTATLALMDIFSLLASQGTRLSYLRSILEKCTLLFVPMLNPDGAEKRTRRTTTRIDMNRDARALVTPEAKILRGLQQKFKPAFGFNLHDQELSCVGATPKVTAIALLAPARDVKKTTPPVRRKAIQVASCIAQALSHAAKGHVARYSDAFEPRAFGDNMQGWGTSTVLIESGHWPGDPEKVFIRRLNVVAILVALDCIARGSLNQLNTQHYDGLPENGKSIVDVLIRNLTILHPSGKSFAADLGLSVSSSAMWNRGLDDVVIKEFGDLSTFAALHVIDGKNHVVRLGDIHIDQTIKKDELQEILRVALP